MESIYHSIFPIPPSGRPVSSRTRASKRNSTTSTVSQKFLDRRALTPLPLRCHKINDGDESHENHEIATQYDINLVCGYIRNLRDELNEERRLREEDAKAFKAQVQQACSDWQTTTLHETNRLTSLESTLEAIQVDTCDLNLLKSQFASLERALSEVSLHTKNLAEELRELHLRLQSDVIPRDPHEENVWSARIVLVLNAIRPNVTEAAGIAYLKLQTGRTCQRISFHGDSSMSFIHGVEGTFDTILRGRLWMPLASHRLSRGDKSNVTLDRLTAKHRQGELWDHAFLDEHCITYDMQGRAHIYIALQDETLTLAEVQAFVKATSLPGKATESAAGLSSSSHSATTSQTLSLSAASASTNATSTSNCNGNLANIAITRKPQNNASPIRTLSTKLHLERVAVCDHSKREHGSDSDCNSASVCSTVSDVVQDPTSTRAPACPASDKHKSPLPPRLSRPSAFMAWAMGRHRGSPMKGGTEEAEASVAPNAQKDNTSESKYLEKLGIHHLIVEPQKEGFWVKTLRVARTQAGRGSE